MNRRVTVFVAGSVLITVLGLLIALPTLRTTAASPAGTTTPHPATAPAPPGYIFGSPPTPNPNGSSLGRGVAALVPSTISSDPLTPAFTAQDAVNYVKTHPAEAVGPSFTVVQAEFLTTRAIAVKYNVDMSANVPTDRLNCIVQLSGNFPGHPAYQGAPVIPIHTIYIIFDAHTGNQVMLAGQP